MGKKDALKPRVKGKMPAMHKISDEELKAAVSYDPDTGTFTHKATLKSGKTVERKVLHYLHDMPYVQIRKCSYRAAVLAYFLQTGKWVLEKRAFRFKDGTKTNLKWSNIERVESFNCHHANADKILALLKALPEDEAMSTTQLMEAMGKCRSAICIAMSLLKEPEKKIYIHKFAPRGNRPGQDTPMYRAGNLPDAKPERGIYVPDPAPKKPGIPPADPITTALFGR